VFLAVLAVRGSELFEYLANPSSFPIGTEMSGFAHSTKGRFLGVTAVMIVLCALGLVMPMAARTAGRRTGIRIVLASLILLITAWLVSTVE